MSDEDSYNIFLLIIAMFILCILLGVVVRVYLLDNTDNSSELLSVTESAYDIDNVTVGIVESQDAIEVDQDVIDALKEQEITSKVEVGDINIEFEIESKSYIDISQDVIIAREEVRPWVSWSSGSLGSKEEFLLMLKAISQLYENRLNSKEERYIVKEVPLAEEELSKFSIPIYYYVDDKGFLGVNCHLEIYDVEEVKKQDLYITLKVSYDGADLKLIEE